MIHYICYPKSLRAVYGDNLNIDAFIKSLKLNKKESLVLKRLSLLIIFCTATILFHMLFFCFFLYSSLGFPMLPCICSLDFDEIRLFEKQSFGNFANHLGYAMQSIGMIVPFSIKAVIKMKIIV